MTRTRIMLLIAFSLGHASRGGISQGKPPLQQKLIPFEEGDRWGYKNGAGQVVIEPRYLVAREFTKKGIAAVADEKEWAYIDRKGNVVIKPFVFENGPDYFNGGLARFTINGKFGFFDEAGKIIIKPQYDFAMPFREGLATICVGCKETPAGEHTSMEGGKWGFVNKSGEIAIPTMYEQAGSFEKGRAQVRIEGMWKFIDRNGRVLKAAPAWTRPRL